jgi:hypothetical protein
MDAPQDWAAIQHNPQVVLAVQGERTAGEHKTQRLDEAVTVFRQALEVRTCTMLLLQWAQTHNS